MKRQRQKEKKGYKRAVEIYRVYGRDGKMEYRGSVKEIADRFIVPVDTVYHHTKDRGGRLLREYALQFDGKEIR